MLASAKTLREPQGIDSLCTDRIYIFRTVVILPGDSISICDLR